MAAQKIYVLNGPNLNLLGAREPEVYGRATLTDIEDACRMEAKEAGLLLEFRQTNAEHEMVGWLHEARTEASGLVINPAAFSYAGYAILDALKMLTCSVIEVHISNIHRREAGWRSKSILTQVVTGIVSGLGVKGYPLAVRHLAQSLAVAA
ncbi:MAG: 3-dehydroquinate dehydratase [Porphyrobacter sp.]|nr:3-dehydroquinate dehydratase [Porphyrobacter sp.]